MNIILRAHFSTVLLFFLSVINVSVRDVDAQSLPPARYDGFPYQKQLDDSNTILIEAFYDPVCPDSRDSWPPLKQALHFYGSRTSLVVHLLPLPYHDNAFVASRTLHIANELNTSSTFPLLERFYKHQGLDLYRVVPPLPVPGQTLYLSPISGASFLGSSLPATLLPDPIHQPTPLIP